MNKKTLSITPEQFTEIITTMREGGLGFKGNNRTASALVVEANLGLRISDIVKLKLCDIKHEAGRYHLDITEQKTGKQRTFTVTPEMYAFLSEFCIDNGIGKTEVIFNITERAVQKQLKAVCDYLGLEGISTHSFRKFFATQMYENNGKDIVLVQTLLQHASPQTTQRYIGIGTERLETALASHNYIM